MTGQSQTKAGQDNLVPLGVENGLGSLKRVTDPKSAFFRGTILNQRHGARQRKAAWLHRQFTPNQLLASVLKKKKPTPQIVSQSVLHYLLLTRF